MYHYAQLQAFFAMEKKIYINKEVYCRKSSDMKSWRDQDSLTGK
jgi:hypothetical protein